MFRKYRLSKNIGFPKMSISRKSEVTFERHFNFLKLFKNRKSNKQDDNISCVLIGLVNRLIRACWSNNAYIETWLAVLTGVTFLSSVSGRLADRARDDRTFGSLTVCKSAEDLLMSGLRIWLLVAGVGTFRKLLLSDSLCSLKCWMRTL